MLTPPPCSRNKLNKGTAIRAGAIVAASAAKVFDFSTQFLSNGGKQPWSSSNFLASVVISVTLWTHQRWCLLA